MPYVENIDWTTVQSSRLGSGFGPITSGEFVTAYSRDLSWRTGKNALRGRSSTVVPIQTVEPYSWFVDLQNLKKRALTENGFDASAFRVDTGHPWENEKFEVKNPLLNFQVNFSTSSFIASQAFPVISQFPIGGEISSHKVRIPNSGLESWAATMYGRMAPAVSEFSLSSFLGELREGLPRLTSTLLRDVKRFNGLGDDYLNVQFGWKPFVNDLRSLATNLLGASYGLYRPFGATHRSRKSIITDEFLRSDGVSEEFQVIAGKYVWPFEAHPPLQIGGSSGNYYSPALLGIPSASRRVEVTRSIEGEFVYIPKAGFDPSKYYDRLETLMSTDITPSTLWQLTPWSWLTDWFSDIGGAISSMEAAISNRVLSTYLYAMETTSVTTRSSLAAIRPTAGVTYVGPNFYSQETSFTRKRRIRANPFGFTGSSPASLTGDQFAILGALGLTRL